MHKYEQFLAGGSAEDSNSYCLHCSLGDQVGMLTHFLCSSRALRHLYGPGGGPQWIIVHEGLKSFRKRTQAYGREDQGAKAGFMGQNEK